MGSYAFYAERVEYKLSNKLSPRQPTILLKEYHKLSQTYNKIWTEKPTRFKIICRVRKMFLVTLATYPEILVGNNKMNSY